MNNNFIPSAVKEFRYYKSLAENAWKELTIGQMTWKGSDDSNSIAIIVRHMSGNMLSRFTDFLVADGEKAWRNRDLEFTDAYLTKEELMIAWEKGWQCVFDALDALQADDLEKIVYIRGEPHSVTEAVNRQIAHYCYHVGQIVFIAKMLSPAWRSLTIPVNQSQQYNLQKRQEKE